MEPMIVNEMKDISVQEHHTTTTTNIPLLLEILDSLHNETRKILLHYSSIKAPSNCESLLLFRIKTENEEPNNVL
jgi:hypothetical protein